MNQSKSYPVDVSSAERILGYRFHKPSLLEHALTHASYSNGTISYQRLEFVGDAALNLAMANYLNLSYPNLREGDMSRLRSANVSNEKLARVAVRHNIYPLMRINCAPLHEEVKIFTEAVKQEPEDEIYGGSTPKAPKVLADVVEAIAAAIYQDCNNLDMMWEVVKRLLEPLITADTFDEQPVTDLKQLCEKNGKVAEFNNSRKGKKFIFEVLVDSEKVGYGLSKHTTIAKLNAARDALEKLNVRFRHSPPSSDNRIYLPQNLLTAELRQVLTSSDNQIYSPPDLRQPDLLTAELRQVMTSSDNQIYSPPDLLTAKLRQPDLLTTALRHSPPCSDAGSTHRHVPTIGSTRSELRPTNDERDKIEQVKKEAATKHKLNELCMKRNWPPPEYHETEGMTAEEEKGKGEGHVADPQPQVMGFPQPALSPGLTASPQPAPGYNVTIEGRERRERGLPCCGLLFILGFFFSGIPWFIGAIICFSRVDYCTIAVVLVTIAQCIIIWRDKRIREEYLRSMHLDLQELNSICANIKNTFLSIYPRE